MTDADETRAQLDVALSELGVAMAILNSLEATVENMKTIVTVLGVGSNIMAREHLIAQALSRTMVEISTIHVRLQRLVPALEDWRRSV